MLRREFIAGLGVAVWPVVARAQQAAMPVIGYLSSRSSESDVAMLAAFRRGLVEIGYTEGRNVAIEYRFADGQTDRLPTLAMDLTGRHVAAIIYAGATGNPEDAVWRPLRASNIPIVFNGGGTPDPVRSGLVSSFNRPGGNITGIFPINVLMGKHMGLLHELVPYAKLKAVAWVTRASRLAPLGLACGRRWDFVVGGPMMPVAKGLAARRRRYLVMKVLNVVVSSKGRTVISVVQHNSDQSSILREPDHRHCRLLRSRH